MRLLIFCLFLISTSLNGQNKLPVQPLTNINVVFFNNFPFCYKDQNGKLTGIEIDLFYAFKSWAAKSKRINFVPKFTTIDSFEGVYNQVKSSNKNDLIGMASVSISTDRQAEVDMTVPYMKNKSLLITNSAVRTILFPDEVAQQFKGLIALTIQGSVHEKQLIHIKKTYLPDLVIEYRRDPLTMLKEIVAHKEYFCYTDIATYWSFLRLNQNVTVKSHNPMMLETEYFGLILPKGSKMTSLWNEFFESGLGFSNTAAYTQLLEKHLGPKVAKVVGLGF